MASNHKRHDQKKDFKDCDPVESSKDNSSLGSQDGVQDDSSEDTVIKKVPGEDDDFVTPSGKKPTEYTATDYKTPIDLGVTPEAPIPIDDENSTTPEGSGSTAELFEFDLTVLAKKSGKKEDVGVKRKRKARKMYGSPIMMHKNRQSREVKKGWASCIERVYVLLKN